jgi:hypothetical protein
LMKSPPFSMVERLFPIAIGNPTAAANALKI